MPELNFHGPLDVLATALLTLLMLAFVASLVHLVFVTIRTAIAHVQFVRENGSDKDLVARLEAAMAHFNKRILDSALDNGLLRRSPEGYVLRADEDIRQVILWLVRHLSGRWRITECGSFVLVECEDVDDANLAVLNYGNHPLPDGVNVDACRDLPWRSRQTRNEIQRDLRGIAV